MKAKALTSKGTRDFNSIQVFKRDYIINTIKSSFNKFGFSPIETPSFENTETLLGKYGDEGDRLIFKILKSGNFKKNISDSTLLSDNLNLISTNISDKALRYDLTIPFARFVVQNQNEINLPFKRYQIQLVWRADRPQKGRFREFLQCDADVIGSKSLLQEVDFIHLFSDVFNSLKIPNCKIRINHRKILIGLSEVLNLKDELVDLTVVLDKIDKIGNEKVINEIIKIGLEESLKPILIDYLSISGDFKSRLDSLKKLFKSSVIGLEGVSDLFSIYNLVILDDLNSSELILDTSLARGLSYYTGAIFEVNASDDIDIGSIAAGGRYDDLTSLFGLNDVSGVGISFGLDRIFIVMDSLNLFPKANNSTIKVLFTNTNSKYIKYITSAVSYLRKNKINTDFYPDTNSLKKQLKYANNIQVPYVVIVEENEFESSSFCLKNMSIGNQQVVSLEELVKILKK
jgi:histidyl-tRNA synthetase|tara:strand:+ start:1072 stop:2445 length:1374 start_codon:yes stop_codon:yes gene_type:complete